MNTNHILIILAVINLAGFAIVAIDKRKARRRLWRIRERTFFILAALGGCVGIYTAMLIFRHKTRHWYFMLGIPIIFVIQAAIVCFIYWKDITNGIF